MKTLSKSLMLICSMLINAMLFSQAVNYEKTNDRHLDRLVEKLEMNEDQLADFNSIYSYHKAQVELIVNNSDLDRNQKKQAISELKVNFKKELSGILTTEQIVEFDRMKLERKEMKSLRKERKLKMRKERKELRKSSKEQIVPVFKKWRMELEEYIEDEDKEKISILREEMKSFREETKAQKKSFKEQGRKRDQEEIKALKEAFREKNKIHKEELKILLEKYRDPINKVLEEHRDELKSIKEDNRKRREIRNDNRIERRKLHDERNSEDRREGREKRMEKGKKFRKMGKKRLATKFLLIDPYETSETLAPGKDSKLSWEVFPNPSSDYSIINYEIKQDGPIKIELLDPNGNLIRSLLDQNVDSGKHQLRVDLSTLNGTKYFLRFTDQFGVYSESLILPR